MYWRKTCLSVTSLRDLSLAACRRIRLNSLGLQSTITVCLVGLYAARIGKSAALSGAEKLEVLSSACHIDSRPATSGRTDRRFGDTSPTARMRTRPSAQWYRR